MWIVTALHADGTRSALQAQDVGTPDGPFSSRQALEIAQQLRPDWVGLLNLMWAEMQGPGLAFSAIEAWAENAQTESKDLDWTGAPKLVRHEEALGRYRDAPGSNPGPQGTGERPAAIAWHDRVGILLALNGDEEDVTIEYLPSREDRQRVQRLLHRYGSPDLVLETLFDWRGYFGSHSAVIDGWTLMRKGH